MTVCDRIRTHEGSGLTIRIPRQLGDRSAAHPTHHPLVSPVTHARSTTPVTHARSTTPVTKSKSFSTSMDKLTSSQHQHQQLQQQSSGGSSRESSQPCSRGSTPSSSRSSVPSRPPSRRSYPNRSSRSPDRHTPEHEERCAKTNSPSGSEVSLHSVKSAASAKSSASTKSSLSAKSNASAKSSLSAKSNTSTRSNLSVRSSASAKSNGSAKSDISKSPRTSPNLSAGSSKQSLKSATPKSAKARSPAPTHGTSSNGVHTPSHTANRRRSTASNVSSASSGDAAHHNGMANQEQQHSTSSSRRTTPPRQTPSRNSGSGTPSSTGTPRHMANKKPLPVFNSYMSLFQVQEKLKKGEVIEGVLRINPKNYEDAYISAPDGGMDIYIGGVRDRNAALHGDVVMVEINPHNQWKVLYEHLDEYLEKNPREMSIVYSSLEPNISASVPSIASPYNHMSNKTNYKQAIQVKENKIECTNIETLENLGHLEQCDSDVVIEEDDIETKGTCEASALKLKKKRSGRGKKRHQQKGDSEPHPDTSSLGTFANDSQKGSLAIITSEDKLSRDKIPGHQLPQDLTPKDLLPKVFPVKHSLPKDPGASPHCDSDEEVKKFAVPPDQLSECDFTDDESVCSENLDYEQVREDEAFIRAQWKAYQEQQSNEMNANADRSSEKPESVATAAIQKLNIQGEHADIDSKALEKIFSKSDKVDVLSRSPKPEMRKVVPSANSVNSVTKDDQEIVEDCASNLENVCHNTESLQGAKKKERHRNRNKSQKLQTNDEPRETKQKFEQAKSQTPNTKNVMVDNSSERIAEKKMGAKSLPNDFMKNEVTMDVKSDPSYQTECQNRTTPQRNQNSSYEITMPIRHDNKRFVTDNKLGQERQLSSKHTPGRVQKNNEYMKKPERVSPSVKQVQRMPYWEKFVQRTAHVVYIVTKKHSRVAAGSLKLFADKNPNMALFSPYDNRIPRLKIPMKQCPPDFIARHQDYLSRIFLAQIVEWNEPKFAFGELVRDIGLVGDVEAETEALLLEHDIDYSEFPESVTQNLPTIPWSIPPPEIMCRTDLRNECIFTIDPATARDLDDAVSCQPLPSGNFKVGVHIADVCYFIEEESPLDIMASDRATSVYLTQKVIPMLPRVLCEHLCSLNPGEDRLAFSVIWELTPQGKVIGEWFGRTVIRSCIKLSYDHAQSMIENPKREWSKEEMPDITGNYTFKDISTIVNNLQSIAKHLRKKRFDDGALRLDQVRIGFNLDHQTGMPNGFYEYVLRDSNRLIEEFMLLANMAVAHKIYQGFPDLAILRRHPPPLEKPMENLGNLLNCMNVHLDISTAGALQRSLQQYIGDDKYSESRLQVIIALCSKPMQNAKYFCAGVLKDEPFNHYALNVPLYTHFTSPIRRYADILVHRMLAAVLEPNKHQPTSRHPLDLKKITERCNDRKQTSKIVQEMSGELYLSLFIKQIEEINEEAMVTMVLDRAFDVLVLRMGIIKRVYIDKLPLTGFELKKHEGRKYLYLYWKAEGDLPNQTQQISLFTLVSVTLRPMEGNALKFSAFLNRPS